MRNFTTNDPSEVASDFTREALLTQIRMRDEAIEDLRNQLGQKRSECDRWVAYNNQLAARLERAREALK